MPDHTSTFVFFDQICCADHQEPLCQTLIAVKLTRRAIIGDVIINTILSQCWTSFAGQTPGCNGSPVIQNFNDVRVNLPPSSTYLH